MDTPPIDLTYLNHADVQALADHFLDRYAKANGMKPRPLSPEARRELTRFRWPGNVRELENCMHRAVLLASGETIDLDAVRTPDGLRLDEAHGDGAPAPARDTAARAAETAEAVTRALVGRTVADVERELILETLGSTLGNRTHAANILGISIRTLRNKLKEYGDDGFDITPPGGGIEAA